MRRTLFASVLLLAVAAILVAASDLFQQAWDQAWRGQYREAIGDYQEFARSDGDHRLAPVALFNAASLAMVEIGDLEAAKKDFLKLTEKYPQTKWAAEAYHRLAEIALEQGNSRKAVNYYRSGLGIAEGDDYRMPDSWVSEMVQGCRQHVSDLNDPAAAVEIYSEITANIPPGEAAAQVKYDLAQALKAVDRRGEAARALTALMYAYPYSPWAARAAQGERELVDEYVEFPWEALGQISQVMPLTRRMQYEEAYKILEDIAQRYPGSPLDENVEYGLISIGSYLTGDFETCMDQMEEYMDKYPGGVRTNDASRRVDLCEEILRMKDRLEYDPEDYGTQAQLGFTLLQNRFIPQAEEHFLKAAEDSTSDAAYMGLGYVYLNTGRPEEGVRNFERYLQNHRDDGNIFNQVGYAYMGMEQMEKALECFERYRQLEPDNPNSHDSYAECLMNMGRLDEAVAEYKHAIEINPNFTNPYFMLGEVYSRSSDADTALKYYKQYLDLDTNGFQSAQAQAHVDSLSQK